MACLSWSISVPVPQVPAASVRCWLGGGLLTSLLGPASSVLPLRFGHLHAIQFPGGSAGLWAGWLGFLFVLSPLLLMCWALLYGLSRTAQAGQQVFTHPPRLGVHAPLLAMAMLLALPPSDPT